jgi:hypothetical protein
LIDQRVQPTASLGQPPPKGTPKTFTLTQVWTQTLAGVDTMTWLPDETPKLLVPCEGNMVAVLDLQKNSLQKVAPESLQDSIIMKIRSNSLAGKRRIGIITLDNKLYLFDESFKPLAADNAESEENQKEEIRDFQFIQHRGDELLLLGIPQDTCSVVRALDLQGATRWEHFFEGTVNQIVSAVVEGQNHVFVSCTGAKNSILALSPEGTALDPVDIHFGRHVLWFHVLDSTIYTLLEDTNTGDVRFAGLNERGNGQWSSLLPAGEYEVEPVYVPCEKKWLVPSPSGEFFVFDQIGNIIDRFSLNVVPTGLLCVEVNGETLLLVADGKTVSAWKVGKL